jgi:hypothetical protein
MLAGKILFIAAILLVFNILQINFYEKQDNKTKVSIKLTQALLAFLLAVVGITLLINSYIYLHYL